MEKVKNNVEKNWNKVVNANVSTMQKVNNFFVKNGKRVINHGANSKFIKYFDKM